MADRERLNRAVRYAVLAALVAHALIFLGITIDDAYISFRYSRNLAAGHGMAYDPGGVPVEGYTNFSWVVLGAAGAAAGIEPVRSMPLIGLAAAIAMLIAVMRAGRALADDEGDRYPYAGAVAAGLLAATTGVAFYAVSGLETLLFTALLCSAGVALARERPAPFALLTAAAFATRPEGALLGLIGVAVLAVRNRRAALTAAALLAVPVGAYLAWKWLAFGALLPNTLHAKSPHLLTGLHYLATALAPPFAFPEPRAQLLAGLVVLAAVGAARAGSPRRTLLWLWCAYAAAAVLAGGDWMVAHRFLIPALPWLVLAAEPALVRAVTDRGGRRSVRALLIAGAAAYVAAQLVQTAAVRRYYRGDQQLAECQADFAEQAGVSGARSIALFDIGVVGYVASDLDIVDLSGLTDPVIARSDGYHGDKDPPPDYLRERAPDLIVITSSQAPRTDGRLEIKPAFGVERRVLAMPWLATDYAYRGTIACNAGYYMNVFGRK